MSPMYQFRCSCGHESEALLAVEDRDEIQPPCEKCGKGMKRVPAAASLHGPKHESKAILGSGQKVSGTWEK